jgi:hypothetical protein
MKEPQSKRKKAVLSLLFCVLVFVGCQSASSESQAQEKVKGKKQLFLLRVAFAIYPFDWYVGQRKPSVESTGAN